jgi:dTDP-glucose pyrophosphorylase
MIAIIPAAGEGKRLAEIQPGVPKALKKIGGKPMICHTLNKIFQMEIKADDIYIVINPNDALLFQAMLQKDIIYWGLKFVEQPMALGTGDAVMRVLGSLPTPYHASVLVMYPDVLVDLNVWDFIKRGNAVMTKPRGESGSCVYRSPSDPDRIISVSEKPRNSMGNVNEKLGDWYFVENAMYLYVACMCLSGLTWEGYDKVIKPEKTNQEFSLTQAIDALMRCGMHFRGVHVENYYGMGNPEAFAKAEDYLSNVQK